MNEFIHTPYFTYILIPFLICLARIVDVSLGTLRIILVSKGVKKIAPFLGFFEILIWLVAIGQVMQNLTNIVNYFAYALGFALGNYIGIIIEQKLAMGTVGVQVITRRDASELIKFLREEDFVITVSEASGLTGPVHIIYTVTKRSKLQYLLENIRDFNPRSFYIVEDIRSVADVTTFTKKPWWKPKSSAIIGARKAK